MGGLVVPPAALVTADRAESLGPLALAELGAGAIRLPALGGIDLVLLGTGAAFARAPAALVADLAARGIRVEAMDSAAAARTFNVLVAEQRAVAALLL